MASPDQSTEGRGTEVGGGSYNIYGGNAGPHGPTKVTLPGAVEGHPHPAQRHSHCNQNSIVRRPSGARFELDAISPSVVRCVA